MFSFFFKKTNKITSTNTGDHTRHWYCLYGPGHPECIFNLMVENIKKNINNSIEQNLSNNLEILNGDNIRSIINGEKIISAFPYFRGSRHEKLKVHSITEWDHVKGVEAIVTTKHHSGAPIRFFATDYSFNSDTYKYNSEINLNIVGLAYNLEDMDLDSLDFKNPNGEKVQVSEDFCSYLFAKELDEINLIAKIYKIKQLNLGDISGFLVTVNMAENFLIDIFIAKENLNIELIENKHIFGTIWLLGTLEK